MRWKCESFGELLEHLADVETAAYLANERKLKRVWVLKAGELDEKKGKEIGGAAVEFLKGVGK